MSDEEDYMSNAFLQKLEDTRPGLVPKHVARANKLKEKEKVANEKNKKKPKAVLEQEKRKEGLDVALGSNNKGFSMLQKMGYKPGMAIGKSGIGRTEPVPVEVKLGRGGLGRDTDVKRKKEERQNRIHISNAKKQKLVAEMKQTFLNTMNQKMTNKQVERDFYRSQKVCEQLDSQMDITAPHEPFFWPEALLPKEETSEADDQLQPDDRLDRLSSGYSNQVQDGASDSDSDVPPDRLPPGLSRHPQDDEDEEEEEVKREYSLFTIEERLEVLTLYLRTKHKYCIWCGTKYEDKDDLMSNCPGNSAELHDD